METSSIDGIHPHSRQITHRFAFSIGRSSELSVNVVESYKIILERDVSSSKIGFSDCYDI